MTDERTPTLAEITPTPTPDQVRRFLALLADRSGSPRTNDAPNPDLGGA